MAEQDRIRTRKIQIFLSDGEFNMLADKAGYCGVNKSEFIREIIINGAIIKFQTCDIKEVITAINRCGNNLNQIAHRLNETRNFYEGDFNELRNAYDDIFEKYRELVMGE